MFLTDLIGAEESANLADDQATLHPKRIQKIVSQVKKYQQQNYAILPVPSVQVFLKYLSGSILKIFTELGDT